MQANVSYTHRQWWYMSWLMHKGTIFDIKCCSLSLSTWIRHQTTVQVKKESSYDTTGSAVHDGHLINSTTLLCFIQVRGSNYVDGDMIRRCTGCYIPGTHQLPQYNTNPWLRREPVSLLMFESCAGFSSMKRSNIGGRCGSQVHMLPLQSQIFSPRWAVAVLGLLDIVYFCTKSDRGVSVDRGKTVGQIICPQTSNHSRRPSSSCGSTSRCLKAIVSVSLAWLVELCPNLAYTTRYKIQEENLLQSWVEPGIPQSLIIKK